ncbi:hypothetical protein TVAG_406060 [Trichomonas vaginalis G3]|uniref:Uncharacterized protein n=1 Tax=Trichomonas vaginalis (strain ATCC PRA-98 / G3) TaxID=412133 RepID=A2DV96_TRIV3|nr:hypothetical protein TVAGG3_0631750 [Trichomonas vaginalis G3]EAY15692.1 hypothetical protein TVAG_406060 [Trichomonas vaginalis G3]KAI5504573.1 hypothetical protein TVAGG3_0631750 [Trichomonas vaginalis G3]|eukprot:XP_001327915.1 hypothetical protein [Trichomonas vaginalis G3]
MEIGEGETPPPRASSAATQSEKVSSASGKHKTIRKIKHRDGTVTLIQSDDPEFDQISKSKKKVYSQTVHIRKITKTNTETGETVTEFERIKDHPVTVFTEKSSTIQTPKTLTSSAIENSPSTSKSKRRKTRKSTTSKEEQSNNSVTSTPATPTNKKKKKKKTKRSNTSTTLPNNQLPDKPMEEIEKIQNQFEAETAKKENSSSKKKSKKSKVSRSKSIGESIEISMLSIPDSDSEPKIQKSSKKSKSRHKSHKNYSFLDPHDVKLYDKSIYDFESDSEFELPTPMKEPPPVEKRYFKLITQHKNPNTNTIVAIEQLIPKNGHKLPPNLPEFNVVPLDIVSLHPISPPNTNLFEKNKKIENNILRISNTQKMESSLSGEFASDEESLREHQIKSQQKVYFRYSQKTHEITDINNQTYNIIENTPEFVQNQIVLPKPKVKIYKRKPNSFKNEEFELKQSVFLPDNERYSISPMILSSDAFREKYGNFPAKLKENLSEIEIEKLDNFEPNPNMLKKVKPCVVLFDKKFYLETIDENGVLNRARCTEDGKKIVVCSTKDPEEEIQAIIAKRPKPDEKKKSKRRKRSNSIKDEHKEQKTPKRKKSSSKDSNTKQKQEDSVEIPSPNVKQENLLPKEVENNLFNIKINEKSEIKNRKGSFGTPRAKNHKEAKSDEEIPVESVKIVEKKITPKKFIRRAAFRTIDSETGFNERPSSLVRANSVEPPKKLTKKKFISTKNLTMIFPEPERASEESYSTTTTSVSTPTQRIFSQIRRNSSDSNSESYSISVSKSDIGAVRSRLPHRRFPSRIREKEKKSENSVKFQFSDNAAESGERPTDMFTTMVETEGVSEGFLNQYTYGSTELMTTEPDE